MHGALFFLVTALVATSVQALNCGGIPCDGEGSYCCTNHTSACCWRIVYYSSTTVYVYQYWWFWIVCLLIVAAVVAAIFYIRRRRRMAGPRYVRNIDEPSGYGTVPGQHTQSTVPGQQHTQPYPDQTPKTMVQYPQ